MNSPSDVNLPFFSYGVFKPGQLAFFQLIDFVTARYCESIKGELRLRDGLPIIDPDGSGEVEGMILEFKDSVNAGMAYDRICGLEPGNHYRWDIAQSTHGPVNVLYGKSPKKGSTECEEEWDGKSDPLFSVALDVIEKTLNENRQFEWDLQPMFRLEMAYLLLWSSIERYLSLRYHLGSEVSKKIANLAQESAFRDALTKHVAREDLVFRADEPGCRYKLDPNDPKASVNYYYQIRSNISHRGKAVTNDHKRLMLSLDELLPIFRVVLEFAFIESAPSVSLG